MNCPYCHHSVFLSRSSEIVYRKDYGPLWICSRFPQCDSYVGCHPGTDKPLGTLANKELRDARSAAHARFDPLWIRKAQQQRCSKGQARRRGYRWLAKKLGIKEEACHIAMFDVETCRRVVQIVDGLRHQVQVNR